jgi:hypothetical protein
MIEGQPEFEVETILAKKVVRGHTSYLVKWVGLDHCEDMWIKDRFLDNARDIVIDELYGHWTLFGGMDWLETFWMEWH